MKHGYIQVYTGNGKGKTTASLGLALRASGRGLRVFIGQFMKGGNYGELQAARKLDGVAMEQYGEPGFVSLESITEEDRAPARKGLKRLEAALASGDYDLVIFEEVNMALYFGLLTWEAVARVLDKKPDHTEVVCTGRNAPEELIARADLVTEMREIKHYYQQGVQARVGIEL